MTRARAQYLLLIGLTAVFIGIFSVWLPGPGAGLSLIGIEMGEWLKFMGVGLERNLFYLPPISLALMLELLTLPWQNGRWQTWLMRGLGISISLLVFPALEDISGPNSQEYSPRLWWIGLVVVTAVAVSLLGWKLDKTIRRWICWSLLLLLGLVGIVQPTRIYLQVQPNVSQLFGVSVGFGWGLILNGLGHLIVTGISLWQLFNLIKEKRSAF